MSTDLYTGKKIKLKDRKAEDLDIFQSRKNMIDFFKTETDPEKIKNVVVRLIRNRKKLKLLTLAPSTVELRSTIMPSVQLLKKMGLNYNELCSAEGLSPRFDYENEGNFKISNSMEIWIDTREQKPIRFGCPTKYVSLAFGDYCCPQNASNIYVERKSISDLISTISQGWERFNGELERVVEADSYLFVLVEVDLTQAMSFNFLPHMRYTKATPDFIFNRIRTLCQEYKNIQFVFCKGRTHLSDVAKKIFSFNGSPQNYDWQYLIDIKKI